MGIARLVWCFVPLVAAFLLISALEDRMNRAFSPFTGGSPAGPTPPGATGARAPELAGMTGGPRDRFKIVIDPGHGGRAERKSATSGDNWDSDLGEFMAPYLGGGARTISGVTHSEHEIALQLARRVKLLLDRTADDLTWPSFEKTVRGYLEISKTPIRRVWFESLLVREDSYLDHPPDDRQNANHHFRLFDSPRSSAGPDTALAPGRISRIVAAAPDLVLSLHVNDSPAAGINGATALFVPPHEFFEEMRQMVTGAKPWKDLRQTAYYPYWTGTRAGRNRREEIGSEVGRYFLDRGTGSGGRKTRPGSRRRHVTWRYRDEPAGPDSTLTTPFAGPFWERERSVFERQRRSGGPEEIGGDNLYAGQELIRFMRYALWKDRLQHGMRMGAEVARSHLSARPRKPSPDQLEQASRPSPEPSRARPKGSPPALEEDPGGERPPEAIEATAIEATAISTQPVAIEESEVAKYLGRHQTPIGSDWAVPFFCNSVAPYLELAYLSNPADLWLLENKLDVIAEGLAVGMYALAAGLRVKPLANVALPRGLRIDWERYQTTPWKARYVDVARQVVAR